MSALEPQSAMRTCRVRCPLHRPERRFFVKTGARLGLSRSCNLPVLARRVAPIDNNLAIDKLLFSYRSIIHLSRGAGSCAMNGGLFRSIGARLGWPGCLVFAHSTGELLNLMPIWR